MTITTQNPVTMQTALLWLMSRYARTGCLHSAHGVVDQLTLLLQLPDSDLEEEQVSLYSLMLSQWRQLIQQRTAGGLELTSTALPLH